MLCAVYDLLNHEEESTVVETLPCLLGGVFFSEFIPGNVAGEDLTPVGPSHEVAEDFGG